MGAPISPRRREQVLDALRRGTVPQEGLAALAVGRVLRVPLEQMIQSLQAFR